MARILLIDDDKSVRTAIKTSLEVQGHEVVVANDGHEGVKTLETARFDVAIVDMFMPGMDGIETINVIRQRKLELPIIMMSGSASPPDFMNRATKLGAVRSLCKPFRPRDLSAAIADCLRGTVGGETVAAPMARQGDASEHT